MRGKTSILLLSVILIAFCMYDLSFTFMANSVKQKATTYATDAQGRVNQNKKQAYLDSVWTEPVFNLLGVEYTYKDIKERELSQGLDLQGGMHVTLEVAPADIVRSLAGANIDPAFEQAIKQANEAQKNSQADYVDLFFSALDKTAPNVPYATYFASSATQGKIDLTSSNTVAKRQVAEEVEGAVDRAFEIIRTRIDKFGVASTNIQRIQGTNRLQIELPGVDNPERVRKLLQGVAKLEFMEVWTNQEIQPYVMAANQAWVAKYGKTAAAKPAAQQNNALFEGDSTAKAAADTAATAEVAVSPLLQYANQGLVYSSLDTAKVNAMFNDKDVAATLPSDLVFLWSNKPIAEEKGRAFFELLPVRKAKREALGGDVIVDAANTFDQMGRPAVSMAMNVEGAKKWKKLTGQNLGRRIAIVLDNRVYTAPTVQSEIGEGRSEITGNFDVEETKDLANVLKAGKLPAPTKIVEEVVIGPSLGKEAQDQGLTSVLIGMTVVALFMIAYYAKAGMVADVAMMLNVVFVLGILAELGASLTLPGIAGIVLTIGMAIDANVVIFERIRNEYSEGKSMLEAIKTGYDRAFWSIFDSNITTLLTGFTLYFFGAGPVKGFAVTMIIGIISSFFTALFVSRLLIEWLTKNNPNNVNFSTTLSNWLIRDTHFDFMGKRKLAYAFSAFTIVAGLGAVVATGGFNLGVDFQGGRTYIVQFDHAVVPSDMQVSLAKQMGGKAVEVKTYGDAQTMKVTSAYLADDDSDEADKKVETAVISGIESFSGDKFVKADAPSKGSFIIASSSKVGATMADDMKSSSIYAVVVALVLVFGYITLRFHRWTYGLGAVVALFHDALFVMAAYGVANILGLPFEVDQVFVAAVLTVIGYSINDTVIIFDYIREFNKKEMNLPQYDMLNIALNKTLNRTIITSLTTFLVVGVLFFFGGEVLRGFSFSLLVGIFIGTYSSIFVAVPVVYDFAAKKKQEANA